VLLITRKNPSPNDSSTYYTPKCDSKYFSGDCGTRRGTQRISRSTTAPTDMLLPFWYVSLPLGKNCTAWCHTNAPTLASRFTCPNNASKRTSGERFDFDAQAVTSQSARSSTSSRAATTLHASVLYARDQR